MKTITINNEAIKDYLVFLKGLDDSQKLKIISELSSSMIENEETKERDAVFFDLAGKLNLDCNVDDFLADLRESRHFDSKRVINI